MSVVSAQPANTARRRKSMLGIRARLIVVALVAIAPLMFQRVRGLERERQRRRRQRRCESVVWRPAGRKLIRQRTASSSRLERIEEKWNRVSVRTRDNAKA